LCRWDGLIRSWIQNEIRENRCQIDKLTKLASYCLMNVGTFEAKNKLSALLDRAQQGEVIQITRRGKPIAELRAVIAGRSPRRVFGGERELVKSLADDFTAPLDDFKDYEA